MSETISLDWIGRTLREIQADQRSMRDENALTRIELGRMVRREEVTDVLRVLSDRIAGFEAHIDTRFDRMEQRLDQTERSVEERLGRIEALLIARGAP